MMNPLKTLSETYREELDKYARELELIKEKSETAKETLKETRVGVHWDSDERFETGALGWDGDNPLLSIFLRVLSMEERHIEGRW